MTQKERELLEKLEKTKEKEQQIKNRLKQIKAREREENRKKETRKKIVLGSIVMKAVREKELQSETIIDLLKSEKTQTNDPVIDEIISELSGK